MCKISLKNFSKALFCLILLSSLAVGCKRKEKGTCHYQLDQLCPCAKIFRVENFLTAKECDHLVELGQPELSRSTVVDDQAILGKFHEGRTSHGMFLTGHSQDPVVQSIEARIADLTNFPVQNGESLQILYYQVGQEYKPHYDTFDPSTYGGKACYDRGGQRLITVVMYLNTPEEGGETFFPNANVKVTPKKGDAVVFYNCSADGQVDKLAFHGGAPVIKGEKWIATKWIREREFR